MAQHNDLGRRGEELATAFLLSKGYGIIDRNWRSGHKEIDIVAQDGNDIVFVEIKTRTDETFNDARDAVDARKRQLLIYAADAYLHSHHFDLTPRFDIITVVGRYFDPTATLTVDHIIDAYRAPVTSSRKYRSL